MAIGAVAAALGAILAVVSQVDDYLPHFVDRIEIEELHERLDLRISQNTLKQLNTDEDRNIGQMLENEVRINDTIRAGGTPSAVLIEQKTYLKIEQKRIRDEKAALKK